MGSRGALEPLPRDGSKRSRNAETQEHVGAGRPMRMRNAKNKFFYSPKHYRITESFELEGTLKDHPVQLPCTE